MGWRTGSAPVFMVTWATASPTPATGRLLQTFMGWARRPACVLCLPTLPLQEPVGDGNLRWKTEDPPPPTVAFCAHPLPRPSGQCWRTLGRTAWPPLVGSWGVLGQMGSHSKTEGAGAG